MSKYELPCKCGNSFVIEPRQAGQSLVCDACSAAVEVPPLREIRQLRPAADSGDDRSVDNWSRRQAAMFVPALILALVCMSVIGYLGYWKSSLETSRPVLEGQEVLRRTIEKQEPAQLLEIWRSIEHYGLGERLTPAYVEDQQTAFRLNIAMAILSALTLVSLGVCTYACIGQPARPAPPGKTGKPVRQPAAKP
ncbi:hypothetical protein [Lignipirellula cremea]|uniref:Uncharacterized protein n=1 Tax=Lignipirellula cremea TaxID=2528010 RepID=A0A518DNU3_9BACT|nr:hypothetical protein [Lignipirellula cremea]QDU93507.1 hypothetical protein Pla8534_12870 [Lignipirellula cremea]